MDMPDTQTKTAPNGAVLLHFNFVLVFVQKPVFW